jgi:hypothetical protein
MRNPSKIAANLAAAVIVASLFGTSAFAETRHRDETRQKNGSEQGSARQSRDRQSAGTVERSGSRQFDRRSQQGTQTYNPRSTQPTQNLDQRGSRSGQTWDRNRSLENVRRSTEPARTYGRASQVVDRAARGYDRRNDRADVQRYDRGRAAVQQGYGTSRGYDRTNNRGYGRGSGAYDSRHSITMEGRVSRLEHQRGGYRVWLDRGGYSYWIPEARFDLWPFRIGASIRFGGAWDPLGYVNVYDMGPMGGPYYTSGDLRGVVESIDYRRGTAVIRDDISGGFVTIVLRGNDQRMGDLRPGDYVDLSGAWTRNGIFEAYNLENLQDGRNGSGYRN